jgi:hypothetical protein
MKTTLSKAAILPIVSAICLAIGFVTGKPIGSDTVDMIATYAVALITAGCTIWGVVKNLRKFVEKR